jgi:hypothetical protein
MRPEGDKPAVSSMISGVMARAEIGMPAEPPALNHALTNVKSATTVEAVEQKRNDALLALEAQLAANRLVLENGTKAQLEREEKLKVDEEAFARCKRKQEEFETQLSAQQAALAARESEMRARELNAANGFYLQNERCTEELNATIQRLEQRRAVLTLEIENDKVRHCEVLAKHTDEVHARLAEREQRVRDSEVTLSVLQAKLDADRSDLTDEKLTREEMEKMLGERLENEYATARAVQEHTIDKLRKEVAELSDDLTVARDDLERQEDLRVMLDGRSPSVLLEELRTLKQDKRRLEREVSDLKSFEAADELGTVRDERDQAREELENMRAEIEGHRRQAQVTQRSVMERESARLELDVLRQRNLVLTTHIESLKKEVGSLTESRHADTVFPELSRMDVDLDLQSPRAVDSVHDLKAFTDELQTRLAWTQPKAPLRFNIEELQLFMGGLAMSQLHVFQGISGTGKTSLAKAFAKAVGGECQDIAVQAGWRDRSDLLGHYNTFEKRFAEKECLQALYRAVTPSARNRVNIILLDEMNLSRPEQYFADFLSELAKTEDRKIRLIESPEPNAPRELIGGREIAVPDNVWFIGTANQDETTNELADKTHDRAFVLELNRYDGDLELPVQPRKAVYSFDSMTQAFRTAQHAHREAVDDLLIEIRRSEFVNVLAEDFGIGWGNRFEIQARKFLPVVAASGGTFALALDHLLATRIFRSGKVVGRYDIGKEDLEQVETALEAVFRKVGGGAEPTRCLSAIERDIKRLGRGA